MNILLFEIFNNNSNISDFRTHPSSTASGWPTFISKLSIGRLNVVLKCFVQ